MTDETFAKILEIIKTPEGIRRVAAEMAKPFRQRYDKFYNQPPYKRVFIGK